MRGHICQEPLIYSPYTWSIYQRQDKWTRLAETQCKWRLSLRGIRFLLISTRIIHICAGLYFLRCSLQTLLKKHSNPLTLWGRVMHICVSQLTSNGSDNGFSPGQPQAIIWSNVRKLLIRNSITKFSEISSEKHIYIYIYIRSKIALENIVCEMAAILFYEAGIVKGQRAFWDKSFAIFRRHCYAFIIESDSDHFIIVIIAVVSIESEW